MLTGIAAHRFPDDPLDSRDRNLIVILYAAGAGGIGFNRLVKKAAPFASRSTVALRVGRLVRLGYVERIPSRGSGLTKPVRLSFRCHSLMFTVMTLREKTKDLSGELSRFGPSFESRGGRGRKMEGELKNWYDEYRGRFNGLFGMAGSIAVMYGTVAAGDLFLPLIVDDYERLSSEFGNLVRENPGFGRALLDLTDARLKAEGVSFEAIKRKVKEEAGQWRPP